MEHSITMLCWVYMETSNVSGPLFSYPNPLVNLSIDRRMLATYFNEKPLMTTNQLEPNQWHYVGSSYDHNTGNASLWLNGTKVAEQDIGASINLATEENVRMGATVNFYWKRFKGRITAMQLYNVAFDGRANK